MHVCALCTTGHDSVGAARGRMHVYAMFSPTRLRALCANECRVEIMMLNRRSSCGSDEMDLQEYKRMNTMNGTKLAASTSALTATEQKGNQRSDARDADTMASDEAVVNDRAHQDSEHTKKSRDIANQHHTQENARNIRARYRCTHT